MFRKEAERVYDANGFEHALGLYLRTWSLCLEEEYPDTIREIEEKIGNCLVRLGLQGKVDEWGKWINTPAASRGICPVLGIGKLPVPWAEKWNHVHENIRTTSDHGVRRYGEALYKAGKTGEAKSAFERVLFLCSKSLYRRKWEKRHKQLHYLLRYCGKWGKAVPDTVP